MDRRRRECVPEIIRDEEMGSWIIYATSIRITIHSNTQHYAVYVHYGIQSCMPSSR